MSYDFPVDYPTEDELRQANKWWHDLYVFLKSKYQKKDVPQRKQPGADGQRPSDELPSS